MIRVMDEKEHYLLVTDGRHFTVIERRAGLYYRLRHRARHGVALDDPGAEELFRTDSLPRETDARKRLEEVAAEWRDLAEHVR
jgi:hypothetical protein